MQDAIVTSTPTSPAQSGPLVSVIVRSLDRPELRQALASIVTQTWPELEIVVVAAAAGHAPLPPATELAPHAGRRELRLLQTDVQRARSLNANVGLDAATGQYLIFLDDDDWFSPDHVERLVATLQAHPGALAAYTGVAMVDADGRPLGQVFDMPFDSVRQLSGNLTPIHAVLFDRALLQRGCRFDESLDRYEDWDFWLQVAQHTVFVHLPGVSAAYRIHQSSGVHEDAGASALSSARIYAKWQQQVSRAGIEELMRRVWVSNDLAGQLAAKEQQRAQARDAADSAHANILEIKNHVDAVRPALHSLGEMLVVQRGVLQGMGEEQARSARQVALDVNAHAEQLSQQMHRRLQALEEKQQVAGELQAKSGEKAEAILAVVDRQTELLAALDAHHAALQGTLARTDASFGSLASRMEEQAAATTRLGIDLNQLVSAVAKSHATLELLSAALVERDRQLGEQSRREAVLNDTLQAVYASTSWRITQPLRALGDLVARPFRRRY